MNRKLSNRAVPAALVLVLAAFWAIPASAAGCGMSRDPAPTGSVAPPDCCNDGGCPTMTVDVVHPDGIVTTAPDLAPPGSLAAVVRLSPTAISPLASPPTPPFGHTLERVPLRI